MKKLLYLPLLYEGTDNEQKYLRKALSKVFEAQVFDYYNHTGDKSEGLAQAVQVFKPDIIHCQFQGTSLINPAVLNQVKSVYPNTIITQWVGDVRDGIIQQVVEYGKYCDITFTVSMTDVDNYHKAGLKDVRYWQNAVDDSQFMEPESLSRQIIFAGGNYSVYSQSEQRRELVERFRAEFPDRFVLYGHNWGLGEKRLEWDSQPWHYRSSYMVLGHNNVGGHKWWFSDRQLIAMASGRPHLCQYSEGLEEIFTDGVDCVFYRTIDDAIGKAKWLLDNPREAAAIGLQGREKVKKYHTWDIRVQEYIKHIKDYL